MSFPLRRALRLHLAELTPRQRSLLAREDDAGVEARGRLAAIGERDVDAELAACERSGIRLVTGDDPAWPPLLREMEDPPLLLWMRGTLPDPRLVAMAVVGPRVPSAYGLAMASRIATGIAELGIVVVSGGARGVDAAAHRSALAVGRPTVAVLGCGLDVTYPPEHGELFGAIARGGAVVSEMRLGTPPLPHHFPIRNRLLAGWARSVLVIEASEKSGSLITARLALELNRDVAVVPGPVTSRLSHGTNELLARASARVLRDATDAVVELRDDERAMLAPDPASAGAAGVPGAGRAGPTGDVLLDALREGEGFSVDELCAATGLGVPALLAGLAAHEDAGRATRLVGGLWMRRMTHP
jgi:DNA processing protein